MKEIVIVDDHPLVLAALRSILSPAFPDAHVRCITSLAALKSFLSEVHIAEEKTQILMAFIDLNLPDAAGTDVIQWFLAQMRIPVIAVSGCAELEQIRKCAQLGAAGFIEKTSNVGIYPAVANLVLSGGTFFPSEFASKEAAAKPADARHATLTPRQKEVLNLLIDGKPNKIIAANLGLSEGTVKNHVGALLERFQVKSRSQLILAIMKSNSLPNISRL